MKHAKTPSFSKPAACAVAAAALIGFASFPAVNAVQSAIAEGATQQQVLSAAQSAEQKSVDGVTKNETVHVQLTADGAVQSATATETLKNADGLTAIADSSNLSNITCSDKDTVWAQSGDFVAWNAEGEDVTYTGNVNLASTALPVDVSVTYRLNGQVVTAAEIAGKSGDVSVTYEFDNNTSTPFVAAAMIELDDDVFTNVKIDNGKIMAGTDSSTAIGMCLPGLTSQLGFSSSDIDFPESFEITAHAENFSLESATIMVTSSLFEDIDAADFDMSDLSQLDSSMSSMSEAVSELAQGAYTLSDGANTIAFNANLLSSGAYDLAKGLEEMKDLPETVSTLSEANTTALTGLTTALAGVELTEEQKATVDAYLAALGQTDAGLTQLSESIEPESIEGAVTAAKAIGSGDAQLATGITSLTTGSYTLGKALDQFNSEGISALTSALTGSDSPLQQLKQLPDKLDRIAANAKAYQSFGGKLDSMEGTVSFIYQVDAIS